MKAYYINTSTGKCGAIDVEPSFEECYRLLDCLCIDIVVRRVGGIIINIVLDDEGLLKPNRISGVARDCNEMMAGNLLLFGVDEVTHDLRGLTEHETQAIDENIFGVLFGEEDGFTVGPVLAYETR